MTNPIWKLLPDHPMQPVQVVWREWPDGRQESCLVTDAAYLAWLAEGNTPEPADPLPTPVYTCSPWQIRKALNAQGLRQQVEDAVTQSTDQTLKDGWQFATEFRSDDPFVITMGAALNLTEEQVANLIQWASTL